MGGATARSRVTARLTQLRDAYEGFEVTQTTLSADAEAFDRVCGDDRGFTHANVLVTDGEGRSLLVESADGWAYPSVTVTTGQPLAETVGRAVESQTGVVPVIDGIERVAIVGINCDDDPERDPVYQLKIVFSATPGGGEPVGSAAWRENPPVDVLDLR